MLRYVALVCFVLTACGGAQEPRGAAYCRSFENRYLGDCQRQCEAGYELGDAEARETCSEECREDLRAESEFTDYCEAR